ncbi:MAG: hypothetical protein ACEQSX_16655 [Baekduiaceae bacterium]
MSRWWVPEEYVFLDEVPKTSVGKFDKKLLRARLSEGDLDEPQIVDRSELPPDRYPSPRASA